MKRIGALALILGTLVLALVPDPGPEQIVQRRAAELTARLDAGEVQVAPIELLDLMHDRSVRLRIVDIRDEGAWNWFHLVDAERAAGDALLTWGADLDWDEIVVLVDQDGSKSPDAWRLLQARDMHNSYLLDGGIEAWLAEFGDGTVAASALGDRHPAALPDVRHALEYEARVKRVGKAPALSGGCG
jgi:rhodanese-related sulfurtransferase